MKKRQSIGIVAVIVALWTGGNLPSSFAEDGKTIEQMVTEAKTSTDHEAIAVFYENEARAAHEKQLHHQKMKEAYAKQMRSGPKKRTGSIAHCTAIAGQFEQIAKEYEALAKLHHEMAEQTR
jgi:hypothetical protein